MSALNVSRIRRSSNDFTPVKFPPNAVASHFLPPFRPSPPPFRPSSLPPERRLHRHPTFAAPQRDLTQQSAVNKRLLFPRISGAQSRLTVPRPGEMKRHKLKRSLKEKKKKKKVVVVLWLRRHYQRRSEEHAELSFIPVFFVNTKGRGGGGSPPNESKYNNTETPATMEERRQIPTSLCPRRHRPQTLLPGKDASRQ